MKLTEEDQIPLAFVILAVVGPTLFGLTRMRGLKHGTCSCSGDR